ncbi:MAG: 50S ribosomal protein L32 [Candidatus Omnitrophota bacterium]
MPLPKRQHSKQRGRKRRTHWKIRVPGFSVCSQCKKPILPHRVCPFCGAYKGQQIVEVAVKADKKKKKG